MQVIVQCLKYGNGMQTITKVLLFLISLWTVSCTRPTAKASGSREHNSDRYENELFSVEIPKGWICDSSEWHGLDSLKNEIDIHDSKFNIVWFHFVKVFMPIQWKNIEEATEMALTARALSGDSTELIHRIDSVEVGGYPASILYFANYVSNDTIIQKQFVTYLQDSHIVVYFNENFYVSDWEDAQEMGDRVISTIKLKKVKNPLDSQEVLRKSIDEGLKAHPVEQKYLDNAQKAIENISSE